MPRKLRRRVRSEEKKEEKVFFSLSENINISLFPPVKPDPAIMERKGAACIGQAIPAVDTEGVCLPCLMTGQGKSFPSISDSISFIY